MTKNLVIVESPAKAKTINRYLGKDFSVKASFGHVRDLPKAKIGVDEDNNFEPTFVTLKDKAKIIKELREAAKKATAVYLAADHDREGESICYHVQKLLEKDNDVFYRVVFNEITKAAISAAFENPGQLDIDKVEAQQARRILDRLVGYKLSPLLWKKVRRGLSAGRVQSVALRMISERENEIRGFQEEEYWKITANLKGSEETPFEAQLSKHNDKKIKLSTEKQTSGITEYLQKQIFSVKTLKVSKRKRNAPPPFITSTLQQDAFSKIGLSVSKTMRLAQKLYEGVALGTEGQTALITYMRTDSTRISEEARSAAASYITSEFGNNYLNKGKIKSKKVKGAQEAHEAIRPTYIERKPEDLEDFLEPGLFKLYQLIWKRFIASQMAAAEFEATAADIAAGDYLFRAKGNRLLFKGFQAVLGLYKDDADSLLPLLHQGETLEVLGLKPSQHFTQPPARFSEAGLVKEMESRGIGRPSTYASIISTIISREYISREKKRLLPTDLGMVVSDLLTENFHDLMDYEYTARLEIALDQIEAGKENWVDTLRRFNSSFTEDLLTAEEKMRNLKQEVKETDENCPQCESMVVIRWGKFGWFKSCSKYPDCDYTGQLNEEESQKSENDNILLGKDPKTGLDIYARTGMYGCYVQLGNSSNAKAAKGKKKPKRCSVPGKIQPADVDLDLAIKLLALPRTIGTDPDSGKVVKASIGPYGPYVNREKVYVSLKGHDLVFSISLEEAIILLNTPKKGAIKELGPDPETGKEIKVMKGRFGPYVTDGSKNASISKNMDPEEVTMEEAVKLLATAKPKRKGGSRKRGRSKK